MQGKFNMSTVAATVTVCVCFHQPYLVSLSAVLNSAVTSCSSNTCPLLFVGRAVRISISVTKRVLYRCASRTIQNE